MQRYFIHISYNGTHYCGWQTQPNGITVQEVLDAKLSALLRVPTATVGAGRTDTGVHATQLYAHFDSAPILNIERTLYSINKMLPFDIAVHSLLPVHATAHARFDAIERTYHYFVHGAKNPFLQQFSALINHELNVEAMNKAAATLLNHIDFTSFSKSNTDVKTNNCNITKAVWTVHNNQLQFTITANRFLRNMVRAIVGTLIDVGKGKIGVGEFEQIIIAQNRAAASESAPAKGLYLVEVKYPTNYFEQ